MMLPTFRRRILAAMLLLVAFLGASGCLFLVAFSFASSIPPALLRFNYDSVEAADRMRAAINALRFPGEFGMLAARDASEQFQDALRFAQSNITEPGEDLIVKDLAATWRSHENRGGSVSRRDFSQIHQDLDSLVAINERGMLGRVNEAERINLFVLMGAGVVLFCALLASVLLADSFATKLAIPIRSIAESLQARPGLGKKLRLPTPTTVEMRVLIRELRHLWDSLASANQVNIEETIRQKIRLETLLSAVEDGVLVLDPRGQVTHANHLMLTILGLPSQEVVGAPWQDLSTARESYLLLRERLAEGGNREDEIQLVADGRKLSFLLRSRSLESTDKSPQGRIVLLRDITEKRQRERLRAELIDLLSHELKTPVQSLGIAADMLSRGRAQLSADHQLFVDTIVEDVARVREVAEQFAHATIAHSKVLRLDLVTTRLGDCAVDWLRPFEVLARGKNVEIRPETSNGATLTARIDPGKFSWAVANLLSNAVRVAPPATVVTLRISRHGEHIWIEVLDEGPGVSEQIQRRMFEPFFQGRVDGGGSAEAGTLGVGLAIAKEVVEAHGGQLTYEAREPRGAIFRIAISAATTDSPSGSLP